MNNDQTSENTLTYKRWSLWNIPLVERCTRHGEASPIGKFANKFSRKTSNKGARF